MMKKRPEKNQLQIIKPEIDRDSRSGGNPRAVRLWITGLIIKRGNEPARGIHHSPMSELKPDNTRGE
jgi:hypothetical protein